MTGYVGMKVKGVWVSGGINKITSVRGGGQRSLGMLVAEELTWRNGRWSGYWRRRVK